MDEVELNDNVIEHNRKVMELDAQIVEMKSALLEDDIFDRETRKTIEDFVTKAQRLRNELDTRRSETIDQRRKLRDAERKRDDEKRALEIALRQKTLEEELARAQEQYDLITAGATWREWAKQHQIDGAKKIAAGKRVILADKMGLGKSLTALAACDMLQAKRILVIAPNDTLSNFVNEIKRWAPHRQPVKMGGLNKQQRRQVIDMITDMDEFVVILNYEAWRKDLAFLEDLVALKFDTMIIDEAHMIKNLESIACRGVFRLAFAQNITDDDLTESQREEWFARCSVKNVIPMTGTPILNRPQDLFPLLALIMPAQFGRDTASMRSYLRQYCEQDWNTKKWAFGAGGLSRLIRRLESQYVMRDRKTAGVVLPPQTEVVYDLVLDPEDYPNQYKVCTQLRDYAQVVLDEERHASILYMIALITRRRQAMTWPAGIDFKAMDGTSLFKVDVYESIKIDKCIQYINSDVNEWTGFIPDFTNDGERGPDGRWTGERLVVFSQFKEALKEIERRCVGAKISVVRFDGDTDDATKDEVKLDFDRYEVEHNGRMPKWQVVLANYKTGGIGLNFTDCTQTIILDEEWNPGMRDQAYARTDRMGQTEETTVHVLRVQNSIETWMKDLIDNKADMIEGFESEINMIELLRKRLTDGDSL